MKEFITIVVATSLLAGIFAALTSTEADMINPLASTAIAAFLGACVGVLISAIAWIVKKVMG